MLHRELKKAKKAHIFIIQMDIRACLTVQTGHTDRVSLKSQRISGSHTFVNSTRRLDECSDYGALDSSDILPLKANDNPGRNAPRQDTDRVYKKDIQCEITVRTDD